MVNRNSHLLALPESEQIEDLLGDLMPSQPPPGTVSEAPATSSVPGAFPVGQFLDGVNWQNEVDFHSPFQQPPTQGKGPKMETRKSVAVMGALTVSRFLAAVNWPNQPGASRLTFQDEDAVNRARMVVEAFMDEVVWE